MEMSIISWILLLTTLAILAYVYYTSTKFKKVNKKLEVIGKDYKLNILRKENSGMSFKESMDLTNLPIVTFLSNGIKLHFLLDTGSDFSHISKSMLPKLKYERFKQGDMEFIGVEGNKRISEAVSLGISYKNRGYQNLFYASDLEEAFDIVKDTTGVQIHGILGSIFFQEFKYVIDFEELIAYSKLD